MVSSINQRVLCIWPSIVAAFATLGYSVNALLVLKCLIWNHIVPVLCESMFSSVWMHVADGFLLQSFWVVVRLQRVSGPQRERGPDILQCAAFPLQWSTLRLSLTRPPSVTGLSVEQLQLVSLSLAVGITLNSRGSWSTPHCLLWNILKFLLINIWQTMARWVAVVPAWFSVKCITKLNWIYKIGEGIWRCLHPLLLKVWSHNAIKEEG